MNNSPWPSRLNDLKPTAVNRVLQEARRYQTAERPLLSLMRGQPDSATPAHIVEAANQALQKGLTAYPDNQGELALRQAVAEKLQRDQGLTYDPETEILVTDGATGGIFTALGALIQPGDDVLLPDPIYDAYVSPIALWGGRAVPIPAEIDQGRFVIDRDALNRAYTAQSKVLLLNTPWNPTGTVWTRDELTDALAFAADHDLQVISDEIYESLIYDGARHISPAAISKAARQRTVIVNSLSKTYAMTGWRVGYCACPANILQAMLLVWQQFSRGCATFVQHAAASALRGNQSCVRTMAAEFQQRRDLVMELLQGIPGVVPLKPAGGLFVMLDVRSLRIPSDEIRRFLLQEAGVIVVHGSAYGTQGEGTLRVSFAGGGPTLTQGLQRLRDGLLSIRLHRPRVGGATTDS